MCQNVSDFRRGDVCSPGNVRTTGEDDSVIAQDPFESIVGDQTDVLSGF